MGRVDGKVAFSPGSRWVDPTHDQGGQDGGRRQGRVHHRRGPRAGSQPRDPAGRGGRRHHRGRPVRADRRPCRTRWPRRRTWPRRSRQVEALDRRIVATQADVRDRGALKARGRRRASPQLGRLDIVARQRRHRRRSPTARGPDRGGRWQDMIDINLTGVWHTVKAAVPHHDRAAAAAGRSCSPARPPGSRACRTSAHYVAAKHGVIGLMRTLAHGARRRTTSGSTAVHPTQRRTRR